MRHHQLELGDLEDVRTSAVRDPLADAGRVLAAGLHRRLVARELDVTAVCAPSIALAVAMQKSALRHYMGRAGVICGPAFGRTLTRRTRTIRGAGSG